MKNKKKNFSFDSLFDIRSHQQCTLVYATHERGLQRIRKKYTPKDVATKKRARLNHSPESNGTSDDGNVAKKRTKLSVIPSNVENDKAKTTESKRNDETLVAQSQHSIPSCDQCKCNKEKQLSSQSSALSSQDSNQLPKIPLVSKNDEYNCQVYVREEDLNRLIQSGHIFINQGRFHFK